MRGARSLAASAVLLAATTASLAAQHPLVGLPLHDPAYVQLDGLVRLGCGAARVSAYRPFMVEDIRRALRAASREPACQGRVLATLAARFLDEGGASDSVPDAHRVTVGASLTLHGTGLHGGEIHPLWRDVRPIAEGDVPALALGRLRLTWNGGPNLVAVSEAYGQTGRRNDPTVRASPFRNTSGIIDFSDAYLAGKLGPVVLSVGRAREAWLGEGEESLVLSAQGPALDRITLTAQWTHFEFRALLASINDVVLTPAQDSLADSVGRQRWHRMLIGHALTYRPSRHVELTLGETGLIPRQGGGIELRFVNPLMIYQVAQVDRERTHEPAGNTNFTAFGSLRADLGRASVQGDLVIDDIQIDAKDRRVFPDLLGWNVRGAYALPLPVPTSLTLQYRRLGSYTYFHPVYTSTWQQYDQPIGSELGPDADMGRLSAEIWPAGRLRLSAGLARWRRGAQRIDRRPPPDRAHHAGNPFPSTDSSRPAVQRAWLADASAEWLDAVVPLTLRVEGGRIEHVNNQLAAPRRTVGRVELIGTVRFRYP